MHNYNPFVILVANPDSTTKNIRHKKNATHITTFVYIRIEIDTKFCVVHMNDNNIWRF